MIFEMSENPIRKIDLEGEKTTAAGEPKLLIERLQKSKMVSLFIRCSGISFPLVTDSILSRIAQNCWNFLIRIFVAYILVFGLYFCVRNFRSDASDFSLIESFMGLALASQASAVIPSIPKISNRLLSSVEEVKLAYYVDALKPSIVVFCFSILLGSITSFATYCFGGGDSTACDGTLLHVLAAFQGMGQLSLSCLLAVNCMFVMVDCSNSIGMVDQLLQAQRNKNLNIETFNICRNNIQRIVDENYWTYNVILLVALLDILIIIILFYLDPGNLGVGSLIIYSLIFLKELPFVVLALYYAMIVNEKADLLTAEIGKNLFDISRYHETFRR